MTSSSAPALVAACLLAAVAAPAASRQDPLDLSTDALVDRAAAYVEAYQRTFAFLVADEDYEQRLVTLGEPDGPDERDGLAVRRRMTGELFMTYLPVDREWIAVHDVITVDGEPVDDREDLRALLATGDLTGVVERVANHNARYNIGSVVRNFNEPTLPLLIFSDRRVGNFSFDRDRVVRQPDTTLVTLTFEERRRPTLIRSGQGRPVYARGEVTLEAETGRVRQTVFQVVDGPITARLVTTYRHDDKLDLWVPATFAERYERDRDAGAREIIIGEATYTNYRRFEVVGRIKR
jgi:hypothetical protein